MKKLLFIIMMLIALGDFASAQSSGDFAVPLSDPAKRGKLKAHINYGSITIKGTARKDVLVKYAAASDEDEEEDEEDEDEDEDNDNDNKNSNSSRNTEGLKRISGGTIDLEVTETDNYVKVQSDSWSQKINLEIEVPSGFDMIVSGYNDGDLMISNIQGELELTNYNGEITAENISGSVLATTFNGSVKVTFDKVKEAAPMSFSTYNGDIDITYPAATKASLKLKTERGEVLCGFDVALAKSAPIQKKDTKTGSFKVVVDQWIKGDINGAGPEMTMQTTNGDIIIRKK